MVRTSTLSRELAKQLGIPASEALLLVQAAKIELEITTTSLLTEKQAAEIERMVARSAK